jgi:hypothetical protein
VLHAGILGPSALAFGVMSEKGWPPSALRRGFVVGDESKLARQSESFTHSLTHRRSGARWSKAIPRHDPPVAQGAALTCGIPGVGARHGAVSHADRRIKDVSRIAL